MFTISIRNTLNFKFSLNISKRIIHTLPKENNKIRNIALLAHIDAGKTTTTERLLYYSGKISNMGEVHHGNTVTDFMEVERNRGITIASAFVTFNWNKHVLNLVDTPGHIDFTMEVEQSLRVIDGAIIILDASAGVEAQTITVWQQLMRRKLPVIFFVNKMDRKDSDFGKCIEMLKKKLSLIPLPIHLPIKDDKFHGLINVVSMQEFLWSNNVKNYILRNLSEEHDLYIDALNLRSHLVDILSSVDDCLANIVLEKESLELISNEDLQSAIRRVTIARKGFPVLCGSSYKNIGIETLLDSIINYLPSPDQSVHSNFHNIQNNILIARCFKIIHDKQRGALTYFRIFNGELKKGQKIYNINQNCTDAVGKVLKIFADDLIEIQNEKCGNFVAVTGLKTVISGDLISDSGNSVKMIKSNLASRLKVTEQEVEENIFESNTTVPEPVFFCSVEPTSQRWQTDLDKALIELQKEDPSLRVKFDSDAGQTVLAGMGELHLEIIKEKLKTYYGLEVDTGPLQIVFKEEILIPHKETYLYKNLYGTEEFTVNLTLSLKRGSKKDLLILDKSSESSENLAHCSRKQLVAIKSGIISALNNGPLFSCQVVNVHAVLHWLEARKSIPDTFLTAAALNCTAKILDKCGTQLLEPYVCLHITIANDYARTVLSDLAKRRSIIRNIENKAKTQEIICEAPLSELLGYAKFLRSITSGTAIFNMEFSEYRKMTANAQANVLKKLCGY
ncbi:hypothetical protein O3M35_004296 [Rhynocoris fuscipes]|uniref:Tr-type G domain-containing protein n=1 Tax=Rhynocoris fuscipes TaxID=488301 RepID=A0AAW1CLA5_9HEMI